MMQLLFGLIIFGMAFSLLAAIANVIGAAIVYVILPVTALFIVCYVIKCAYFVLNPDAKKAYLNRKARAK